jgi:hypothetical protein
MGRTETTITLHFNCITSYKLSQQITSLHRTIILFTATIKKMRISRLTFALVTLLGSASLASIKPASAVYTLDPNDGKIRGVNIGGLFVLEPFLTPALFEQFEGQPRQAVDEWTFSDILGKEEATKQLLKHWDTFCTEDDIAKLAANGLNRIRIPVGYWMFQNDPSLPYVATGLQHSFLLQAQCIRQKQSCYNCQQCSALVCTNALLFIKVKQQFCNLQIEN